MQVFVIKAAIASEASATEKQHTTPRSARVAAPQAGWSDEMSRTCDKTGWRDLAPGYHSQRHDL